MDPHELVPLEAGLPRRQRPTRQCSYLASQACHRAPLRLCRLLALLILLPSMFILVPLYLRYRVFSNQVYPMSMTDMRLIDGKISPTWCQRQVVKSNATFNAFVVPGLPEMTSDLVQVSMTRELELEDDMKEYWGFYLLKGSSVTVSACVSYPGASLIMIKGYKHLKDCAYIGDDSSEEVDELLEAHHLGLISKESLTEKLDKLKKTDGKANHPDAMRRQKAGVSFHDPNQAANVTSSEAVPAVDVTDHDSKELREILERLHDIRQAAKNEAAKFYRPPAHLISLPALHRHRDTNVNKDERRWISFKNIDGNVSDQDKRKVSLDVSKENKTMSHKRTMNNTNNEELSRYELRSSIKTTNNTQVNKNISEKLVKEDAELRKSIIIKNKTEEGGYHNIETTENNIMTTDVNKSILNRKNPASNIINHDTDMKTDTSNGWHSETNTNKDTVRKNTLNNRETLKVTETGTLQVTLNSYKSQAEPTTTLSPDNSKEIFEEVLQRLQSMGERGKRVLHRLQKTMGVEDEVSSQKDLTSENTSSEELDRLRKILVEAIDEEKTNSQRKQKRKDAANAARAKRELMLGQIELTKQLNEDDEARDYAAEEDLEPDGYAEHHSTVNETTPLDMSNSEFWSSFSSSEEALLECAGLILNLPLTPHKKCKPGAVEGDAGVAAAPNALTYRVPTNGYYFFVFNSENEVQRNYIRAKFDLQKTRYDVARTTLRECRNTTQRCDLSLDIFSSQKVVLEVPLRNNDSLWNEQFVIISECEPRTSVYLTCVIAVPILIMIFAFQ